MLDTGWKRILRCIAAWCFCLSAGLVNAQNSKPNVLVLVLDQLRADELHCYGNPRLTSPNIDKLAARGVLLSHFYTVAPWTSPSFGTLHTSLFPSKHGVTLFCKLRACRY